MLSLRLFAFLARLVTVMVCWVILMGVPVLLFTPPLTEDTLKPYLGVFYALMLLCGTVIARSWASLAWVALMASPFLVMHTMLGAKALMTGDAWGADRLGSLNFFAIYLVVWLGWRLGLYLPSPARDEGKLI